MGTILPAVAMAYRSQNETPPTRCFALPLHLRPA